VRRYWVDQQYISDQEIVLTGDLFHHVCEVCRQGEGNRFELLNGQRAFFVEIVSQGKKQAIAKIMELREVAPLPSPPIHLCLSLPKFTTLEKVLEKSVELGVAELHPFSSDFSFIKAKDKDLAKKRQRWDKIILGATQQTGRGELMKLTSIQPLSVLLKEFGAQNGARGLLAYEGDIRRNLAQELGSWGPDSPQALWIFVGGEGGFSAKDLALFKDYNILPISLGEQVLRVETACVTLLGILKYHLGHFG
jgi:16S rRNA (uracil1498-N3)-methyltransferase